MNTDEKIISWIEAGKQVGGRGKLDAENDVLWLSIAIQKHEEKYKTYSSEIYDSKNNHGRIFKGRIQESFYSTRSPRSSAIGI
ncbi:hypothetical protein [Pseudomonas sp. PICF141]|uniref:hypothetical protein n=1 Tax=Pseudomonas sp. PICF141 TaxID=1949067 RepID=UPI00117ACB22|nr:hypothetical protein [Pseudomonas sp. PICF141]